MSRLFLEQRSIVETGGVARHAYLVYREDDGREWVLSAFPFGDKMENGGWGLPYSVHVSELLSASPDSRPISGQAQRHAVEIFPQNMSVDTAWLVMCQYAREIDQSDIMYQVVVQNSNTFIASLLTTIGINPLTFVPPSDILQLVGWTYYESILFAAPPSFSTTARGTDDDDVLNGSPLADVVYGYSGADFIAGRGGNDLLIGGGHGDRYSVGVGEGYDIIEDRGGGGVDTLILYTGSISNTFVRSWFKADGADLLVQVPNTSGGGWAINIRIRDMGSSANRIERVEIWGGVGDRETAGAWDLSEIWAQETRDPTPDAPAPEQPPSSPGSFTWLGGSGADDRDGGSGKDVMGGLGGDDDLYGRDGDDWLLGNDGDDYLNGGDDDDVMVDDDTGDLNEDSLWGDDGDDTLVFRGSGEGQIDRGDGGDGHDLAIVDLSDRSEDWRLTVYNGGPRIRPSDSDDGGEIRLQDIETLALFFGSGEDTATGGSQIDYLRGGDGDDLLRGEGGDDILYGEDGDDEIRGGSGENWMDGGDGFDLAVIDLGGESGDVVFLADAAAGDDGFTFIDGSHVRNFERFVLTTGSGDDRIWLGEEGDEANTGSGDDVITTRGVGRTVVEGGDGTDRLVVDYSWADATVRSIYTSGDRAYYLGGGGYSGAADRVRGGSIEQFAVTGGGADDSLYGDDGDDELSGGDGNDVVSGGDGNDVLRGGAGDDLLELGSGVDWVDGGSGDDVGSLERGSSGLDFVFDARGAAGQALADGSWVQGVEHWDIVFGSGDDLVVTALSTRRRIELGNGQDRIVIDHQGRSDALNTAMGTSIFGFPALLASAGDAYETAAHRVEVTGAEQATIAGGSAADRIGGLAGGDILSGGAGDDQLFGLDGDDVLAGGAGVDVLNGGAGIDTVDYSTAAAGMRAQLNSNASTNDGDGGTDTFSSIENLTGSAFNDTLIGDNTINVLRGGFGADTLLGLGGNDVIWGGSGALNTLQGGLGDDTYVLEAADSITELVGEGTDTVDARIAVYTLAANVENLVFGGVGNFTGTGNSGNNVITGGAGNDNLRGRGGVDVLNGGQGSDTVDYTLAATGVTARLDLNRATNDGDGATDTFTGIENLTGSNFNDLLIGDGGNNVLMGGIGTDTLLGFGGDDILMGGSGGGNNQLQGGQGNDWYILDAFDTCVEVAGEGIDTVEARIGSYTLGANIENLLYTGPGKFVGSGNALNNVITGGTQNDILKGGGGNDTINGGQGSDELQLRGTKAQYTVTVEGSGYRIVDTVAGRDGSTLVSSIEVLRFLTGNTTTALVYPPVAPIPPEGEGKAPAPLVSPIMDDPPVVLPAIHAKTFEDGPQVLPGPDDGKPELRALFALDNDLPAGPHALYIPPEPDLSVTDSRDWM